MDPRQLVQRHAEVPPAPRRRGLVLLEHSYCFKRVEGLGEVTVPEGFGNSAATDSPAAVVKRPAPPQPAPTRENAVAQSRPSPPTQVRRARTKAPPPGKGSPPRGRSSTAASVPARTAKTPPAPAAPEPNLFRRFLQRVAPPARGATASAGTGDSRNSRPAESGTR
jgi:hypothetical protein